MPTYKGFNTIDRAKKFGIVDFDLIKRDLLNAFLIREGELVGLPEYGTNIWGYIFEQNDDITLRQVEAEVRRVVGLDPRLETDTVNIRTTENTIIIELKVIVFPETNPETLFLEFDQDTNTVRII